MATRAAYSAWSFLCLQSSRCALACANVSLQGKMLLTELLFTQLWFDRLHKNHRCSSSNFHEYLCWDSTWDNILTNKRYVIMEDRSLPGPPNWFVNIKSVKKNWLWCVWSISLCSGNTWFKFVGTTRADALRVHCSVNNELRVSAF